MRAFLIILFSIIMVSCGGGGGGAPTGPRVLLTDNFTGEVFQPATLVSNVEYGNGQMKAQCTNVPLGTHGSTPVPFAHNPNIGPVYNIPGTWGIFSDAQYFNEISSYVPQYDTTNGLHYVSGPAYTTTAGHTMYGWVLVSGQLFDARAPLTMTTKMIPGMGNQDAAVYANEGDYREILFSNGSIILYPGGCAFIDLGSYTPGIEYTVVLSFDGDHTWTYSVDGQVLYTDTVSGPLYATQTRVGIALDGIGSGTIVSIQVTSP
jgi:hypothetical protein